MKIRLTLFFSLLLSAGLALATTIEVINPVTPSAAQGEPRELFTAEAIAGNGGTASSKAVDLSRALYFGLWTKCAGSGPDVKIEWLESPTTESGDFVSVATVAANHTGTSASVDSISPPPMRYGRLKLTGNAGNGANTTCTAKLLLWATKS